MPRLCQSRNIFRLDARIGNSDPAQALRKTHQRVKHHAVVVDMRITLRDEAIGEAQMIKQRDEAFDRSVGRRVAAPRLIGKLVGRSEYMRMRIPCAGRAAARWWSRSFSLFRED
jgi:hypothetical protein